ncbi:MAG: hypothetical protein ACE1ZA_18375 [Pseudomonadales bacterium]
MNITSPNQSLYRVPLGRDPVGGTAASARNYTPRTVDVGVASPAGASASHEARLLRLPNNRLSELHALLTYHGTAAIGATMARGSNIDLYA